MTLPLVWFLLHLLATTRFSLRYQMFWLLVCRIYYGGTSILLLRNSSITQKKQQQQTNHIYLDKRLCLHPRRTKYLIIPFKEKYINIKNINLFPSYIQHRPEDEPIKTVIKSVRAAGDKRPMTIWFFLISGWPLPDNSCFLEPKREIRQWTGRHYRWTKCAQGWPVPFWHTGYCKTCGCTYPCFVTKQIR